MDAPCPPRPVHLLRKEGSVATQTRTRTARTSPAKSGATGAARNNGAGAVVAAADLQPLLDALRAGVRGDSGVRLDAR
jgi:hypothetical protein